MTTSIELDDDLKGRIQKLANQRQKPADRIMHEAIVQYVEREEAREGFDQEAAASWAAYQKTGRHLTGLEVRTWLSTWGTDADLPECHD
ncbi:CopG family ribbon-helix-helix protein [Beijerinckia sp. L45]|uniref:CopG family ribbon-helix-helix protein n=1 Tax=Beijerinckia sp. L45 TaxID=1641855 RepID=UPI00131E05BF|nr:CopG family ribbon-helix-helix protein [Beijerinckia sp. L45]